MRTLPCTFIVLVGLLVLAGCGSQAETATPEREIEVLTPQTVIFDAVGDDMELLLPDGDPVRGEALFRGRERGPDETLLGCVACHSLEEGPEGFGPYIAGITERIPEGYESPEAYLREAIILPDAHMVEGWEADLHPENYGNRLDAQALADLIAFLMTQ